MTHNLLNKNKCFGQSSINNYVIDDNNVQMNNEQKDVEYEQK